MAAGTLFLRSIEVFKLTLKLQVVWQMRSVLKPKARQNIIKVNLNIDIELKPSLLGTTEEDKVSQRAYLTCK